jgi:hypothetical protein
MDPAPLSYSQLLFFIVRKFHKKVSISLLVLEKWGAKIFAVFESFVYRIVANSTFSNSSKECRLSLSPWLAAA